ncbi:putative DNA polymerase [Trachymyrmex septentrionalis]|uniref:DNA-directed DNA polymerase n=1 Tax=Trachymyrmex septentrionalis TaxID=34720 RepID=A0A195FN81_9HYME|nr:putative DNA polymerase [Trachymyrmex septentrionalis]
MYYKGSRHYNPILNLKAAAGSRGGYCVACNVGFRNDRGHRCTKKCPRCYATPSCEFLDVEMINVCESIKICNGCGRLINSKSRHDCDVIYCKTCRSLRSSNHLCYMRPLCRKATVENPGEGTSTMALREENPQTNTNDAEDADERVKKDRVAFVFYDFETRQDETLEGTENVRIHVPTLCVAQQICEACAEIETMSLRCRWCGVREFVFSRDPVKEFVDFATRSSKYFKKFICIAHNAKAFDAQFILKYIVEKSGITEEPRVILNGTKIIVMTIGRTKFIDSSNYIPMRLSELPKAFGLQDTLGKGFFPHLFNTSNNQNYIGPIPDARYYSPEQMKPEEHERFMVWHEEMSRSNFDFNFKQEIIKYCRNDVDILRRACMAFRRIFLERGDVCPFAECTTIASTCMKVFRKNFLREEEIGIIPPGGYRYKDNHSHKALQWLVWMERELGHPIIHAGRGREYRIAGTPVDGYYEVESENETSRYVLQFHGCFWHGCPSCYQINRERKLTSGMSREDTIDARYERTLAMTWRLRQRGYRVIEKWECEFS